MADVVSVIGQSSFVRGRIEGQGSLQIAGRVEGEVSVSGDLTVDASGLCAANLAARRLVVRGAVKGDLTATEAIVLDAGARVVGDVSAPRVAIAEGALVRGNVQTGASSPRAKTAQNTGFARVNATSAKEPRAIAKAPPPPPPATKKAPPAAPSAPSSKTAMPRGSMLAGARPTPKAPPAPVVPVLKKGAKATQKKRA